MSDAHDHIGSERFWNKIDFLAQMEDLDSQDAHDYTRSLAVEYGVDPMDLVKYVREHQ